jgi:hypothetical protein
MVIKEKVMLKPLTLLDVTVAGLLIVCVFLSSEKAFPEGARADDSEATPDGTDLIDPVVLTPDTMSEHEFSIECRTWELGEQALANNRSAERGVLVRFDPVQGPAITEFEHGLIDPAVLGSADNDVGYVLLVPATLVVRDGDQVVLSAPLRISPWEGNDGGLAVEFTLQEHLLEGTELFLESATGSFAVDISSFL